MKLTFIKSYSLTNGHRVRAYLGENLIYEGREMSAEVLAAHLVGKNYLTAVTVELRRTNDPIWHDQSGILKRAEMAPEQRSTTPDQGFKDPY